MKKTLVAVAALMVATGAMAEATISGLFEASVAKTSTGTSFGAGSNGASEITVAASEDLGNGLKAFGQTAILWNLNDNTRVMPGVSSSAGSATATNANTGASIGTYQSWIGLSGEFGSVKLGNFWSNTFLTSATGDLMGRGAYSNTLHGGAQGQIANAINYNSPSISGVSVSYTKAADSATPAEQYSDYSVNYSNGGLNISFASGKLGTGTGTKEQIIAANYNLGFATIYAGTITTTSSAATTSGSSYGVSVPFDAVTVSVGMGNASSNISNYQAMLNYDLSKRTRAYIHTANGTTAANPVTTQVGIRHNF